MNFLIQSTTLNYKINHRIAVQLNKLYTGSKFGVIISSHGNKKKLLEEQDELRYEFIYDITNIETDFLEEDIDLAELKEFEDTIEEKSLWRFIAMDRLWGGAFCKNVSKYFYHMSVSDNSINQENVLKIACGYIKYFKGILSELDANVVLFFPGFHSMSVPILEQICKNMNILHIALVGAMIKKYYLITPDTRKIYPQVDATYNNIINNKINIDLEPGEQCYKELLKAFFEESSFSYHAEMVNKIYSKYSRSMKEPSNYMTLLAKAFINSIRSWIYMRSQYRERGFRANKYSVNYLVKSSYYNMILHYQSKKLLSSNFYDKFDPEIRYLYYPLTGQPEYATQVISNMWINQLTIIETLAKSVPHDWLIYVKEHPGTIGWRVRPFSFYKEIKQYPNVRLIPIFMKNSDVVKHSQMVVSIGSTSAWEAVLFHNKPVINFSHTLYNVTGLAKQCSDLTELSRLIHDEYIRVKEISMEEKKKRLIALINAVLLHSVNVNNPVATFNADKSEVMTNEEIKINANNIANAYKKYIDLYYSETINASI